MSTIYSKEACKTEIDIFGKMRNPDKFKIEANKVKF
jgi:hypothetical protein